MREVDVTVASPQPTQKNIAGRLHHALTGNHALALIWVGRLVRERFQNRLPSLLDLQQQGGPIVADEQSIANHVSSHFRLAWLIWT
jgi:hypothetical protein